MGDIYSKAAQVLVWPGSASAEERLAFIAIKTIADTLKYACCDEEAEKSHPRPSIVGIPPWDSPL